VNDRDYRKELAVNYKFLGVSRAALCCALLIACVRYSMAQTAPASSDALETIVVTAQKRTEKLQDVPVTIVALSSSDLDRMNVTAAADLPELVSGLVWSNQGAWIEPNIRGVYTSVAAIGSGSPIAIYLDGVYQPSQSGTVFDLPDVSRIEVLKGPQGTLFGRNATGGAISIYTKDPTFTPTGSFEAGLGAYTCSDSSRSSGHYSVRGTVSGPLIDETLAGSLSASYEDTDGYYTNDGTGARGGKIESTAIRGKLLWKLNETASILATGYYSYRGDEAAQIGFPQNGVTAAVFYTPNIVPTEPWHYAASGGVPGAWQNNRGASVKATFEFSAGTLTSLSGYSNSDVYVFNPAYAAYAPDCVAVFVCYEATVTTREESATQEFDFASAQIGRFRYVAGLFAIYDKAGESDSYNSGGFTDDTWVTTHAAAVFGEGTYNITDALSAIAGVRFSRESKYAVGRDFSDPYAPYADVSWNSTTPRASLVYKWTDSLNTYFTFSEGFKAGVVSGQYVIAPPANPEKLKAYEVGVKNATAHYSVNVAAFYYDYKDLQVESYNNFVTTPQNAASAEIYGLDLDAALKLTEAFELRLASSWLPTAKYRDFPNAIAFVPPLGPAGLVTNNNYDASDSRMLTSPKFTGNLSGVYTTDVSAGKLESTASIYYSTQYRWDYPGTVETGAYALVNAQVSLTPTNSKFKYSLYGKNLTNRAYVQGALPTAQAHETYYAAPRELGVKVGYSF
jgi:iron complex outermembrane recepter protein